MVHAFASSISAGSVVLTEYPRLNSAGCRSHRSVPSIVILPSVSGAAVWKASQELGVSERRSLR
jgi:hypothetical protein